MSTETLDAQPAGKDAWLVEAERLVNKMASDCFKSHKAEVSYDIPDKPMLSPHHPALLDVMGTQKELLAHLRSHPAEAQLEAARKDRNRRDGAMKFKVGDRVKKTGGTYEATGVIRAAFLARDKTPRYVFDFDSPSGLLHIFNESQLTKVE